MTTLITLDNASFKQTLTGHSGVRGAATVSADLFGGIMVNSAIGSKSQFIASANHMQLTHLRWPGGSLSEDGAFAPVNRLGKTNIIGAPAHQSTWLDAANQSNWDYAYDLRYPELMSPTAIAPINDRASLSDMMQLSRDTGASFELTLPMLRYTDFSNTLSSTVESQLLQRANADVGQLLNRIFVDHQFGALPRESIRATEAFRTAAARFAARVEGWLGCRLPFEPDSNLVCLALNPAGNTGVATMNRFVRALHASLSHDPMLPVQSREFYGSMTTLRPELLGPEETARVMASLGLDPATLDAGGEDDDRLVILRHTLMNPFLLDTGNGISYLEMYFDYLERQAMALVQKAAAA